MAKLTHQEADRQVEMALTTSSPVQIEKFREYLENRTAQPEVKEGEAAPFFGAQGQEPEQRILPVRTPRV